MRGLPGLNFFGLFSANPNPTGPITDRAKILAEVQAGLPNHQLRIADALENQAFYDLDGERYAPRREAETEFDYEGRPQRETGFTQEVIDVLSEDNYSPGPSRVAVDDEEADKLLQEVYEHNHINALMQEAEVLSTLNDCAAIQVHCTNDPDHPVELQIWGSEEFTVFEDPIDPRRPTCVVTIDRINGQTRYRCWFPDEVRTFITKPYTTDNTSGATVAELESIEVNTYGCLPFAFVSYRPQVRRFWTPGLGTFLRKAETRINQKLSDLDEAIGKYLRPIGLLKNVGPEYSPELGPGRFMRLYRAGTGYAGEDFAGDGEPDASYLQAEIDVAGVWLDCEKLANQTLEACRVPLSAVRMEQNGVASGISLIVEQAPLLKRAKARRPHYVRSETCLARVILISVGNHYSKPEYVEKANTLKLLLSWPQPRIPVPGPERNQDDEWELSLGITSEVAIVMERYGLSRDQAIAHLKQMAEDRKAVQAFLPPPPPMPGQEQQQQPEDGKGKETPSAKEPDEDDEEDDDYGG